MVLGIGLPSLVNAAGGLLFALIGMAILVLGRSTRRGILVGGLATSFGLTYFFQNTLIVLADGDLVLGAPYYLAAVPTAAFALLLGRHLLAGAPPAHVRLVAACFLLAVFPLAAVAARVESQPSPAEGRFIGYAEILVVASFDALLLAAALRLRALPEAARSERRAIACLALSVGLWWGFSHTASPLGAMRTADTWDMLLYAVFAAAGVIALAAYVPTPVAEPRVLRNTFVALILVAFLGAALGPTFADHGGAGFGTFGVLRTIGAVLLAVAVLRYDLLGVPLPRFVARRGGIATAALAALLVVAQVAQNFLAAQYGLLMGGVVAGALVFAASPIQRAIERRDAAPARVPPATADNEDAYRRALRIALKDRVVTEDEEIHLADLGERLGIPAGRARELRHEVERETRGAP